MTDLHTSHDAAFEEMLERRLNMSAAAASRRFDAQEIAAAAIRAYPVRRSGWRLTIPRASLGWAVVLLAITLVAAALATGAIKPPPTSPRPALAIGSSAGFWLSDADGSSARLIRTEGPYFQPRWSPDGAFVAVTLLHPEDANHLYVLRADGSLKTEAANVFDFAWSPVGHELALLDPTGAELKIISAETTAVQVLAGPPDVPVIRSFAWAVDGQSLVVAGPTGGAGESTLWTLDRSGAAPRRFTPETALAWPAWSGDGEWLAAVASGCPPGTTCRQQVRIFEPGGGRRFDVQNVESPGAPAWTRTGQVVAFDAISLGQRDVFAYDHSTGLIAALTSSPLDEVLVGWNPDDASVVIWRRVPDGASARLEFWRVSLDGRGEVRLAADAYGVALQPAATTGE